MRKFAVLVSACLFGALALPAGAEEEIYRSVDKDGNVVFSDSPSPEASKVELGTTNRLPTVAPAPPGAATGRSGEPDPAFSYTDLNILSPQDQGSVTNPAGNFEVQFLLEPALRPGDSLRVLLDEEPSGGMGDEGLWVYGAPRGEHQIRVQVLDAEGNVVIASPPIHVTVFRPGGRAPGPANPS